MGPARGLGRSLGGGHLRRLFADLPGIKDEFERIGILVLLHQFEVDEAPGIGHGKAVVELGAGGFQQRGGKFVFAACNQPFNSLDDLPLGHAEIIDQKLCVVGASKMLESLEVCLPIADVLIVKSVDDVFAQDQITSSAWVTTITAVFPSSTLGKRRRAKPHGALKPWTTRRLRRLWCKP